MKRNRSIRRMTLTALTATFLGLSGGPAVANSDSPLQIVWPFPAGGDGDGVLRLMGEYWSAESKQSVVVVNRTGAAGLIAMQSVATAPADGKTMFATAMGSMAVLPHTKKLPLDPVESFVPVCQFAETAGYITVGKHLGFKTFADLVDYARKNPGKLTYSSSGIGTQVHLLGETIQQKLNIKLLHVPYKGPTEAIADILGGRLDIMFEALAFSQAKAGKLDLLATLWDKPPPEYPNLPTRIDLGFQDMPKSWFALFVRRDTPAQQVANLEKSCARVLSHPEFLARMKKFEAQPLYKSAAATAGMLRSDYRFMGDLIRSLNLKLSD